MIRQYGLEDCPPELKSRLPEVDLSNAEHRDSFMSIMKYFGSVHGGISEESLWKLYEAQTLWDEVCKHIYINLSHPCMPFGKPHQNYE